MTWIPDLASCTYVRVVDRRLIAVGWLDGAHDFPTADASATLVDALLAFKARPQPSLGVMPGWHACDLGDCDGRPAADASGRLELERCGSGLIFVPHRDPGALYCAPALIVHYLRAHRYAPPDEFVRAATSARPEDVPPLESDVSGLVPFAPPP